MLVFLDEAGDVGFKFSKGSSRLLIVTIVLFEEQEEAKNCDLRIDLLRNELQLPKKFEFHFKRNLQHDLKKRINRPLAKARYIKMVKVQDSEGNNLIQLADMICGAINRSFSEKPDAPDYRKVIAPREISVQLIPK